MSRLSYENIIEKCSTKLETQSLSIKLANFSYVGFNPAVILKTMQEVEKDDDELCDDIIFLLGLFHMRGPSIISDKKLEGLDAAGRSALQNLTTKYNIKVRANTATGLTLTRISLAFPDFSSLDRVQFDKGSPQIPYPVTDTEIYYPNTNLLYGNYTPCLLDWDKFISGDEITNVAILLHLMYASTLTYKTTLPTKNTKRREASEYMADSYQYTKLSMTQGVASKTGKELFYKKVVAMNLTMAKFEDAFMSFSAGQKPTMLPTDSKHLETYNKLVERIIRKN